MKVYIKPWHQATCFARDNGIATPIKYGQKTILGVTRRDGMWGRICEANKCGDVYVTTGRYSQSYPVCCVDEITPEWLEKNAEIFSEKEIAIPSDDWYSDAHRIVIYKFRDHLNTFFFYAEWLYVDSENEELRGWQIEKFMEIK